MGGLGWFFGRPTHRPLDITSTQTYISSSARLRLKVWVPTRESQPSPGQGFFLKVFTHAPHLSKINGIIIPARGILVINEDAQDVASLALEDRGLHEEAAA
jgi:hypothetical protein